LTESDHGLGKGAGDCGERSSNFLQADVVTGGFGPFFGCEVSGEVRTDDGWFAHELARAPKKPIPIMAITGAYNDVNLEVVEYLGARISVRKPKPGRPLTLIVDGLKVLMAKPPAAQI
jgi:hypothetical protein